LKAEYIKNKISKPLTLAFSPGHITGFFQICDQQDNVLKKGSRGAGVSITKGVKTELSIEPSQEKGTHTIFINNETHTDALVSEKVIDFFFSRTGIKNNFQITVKHYLEIPIGAGLGTSGAGALSLAYALNSAFHQPLTDDEAGQLAHIAEIVCSTGLGTVIAESKGGMEVRTTPGAPGIGQIETISINPRARVLCLIFGPLLTKKVLRNKETRENINKMGDKLVDKFIKAPSLTNFMQYSRRFAEETGLVSRRTKEVFKMLDKLNILCSMPIFGEGVFIIIDKEKYPAIIDLFSKYKDNSQLVLSNIDFQGGRLLNEA